MKNILMIAVWLIISLIPSTLYACSCVWATPATAFNDAKAVFIGKMVSGTEQLSVTGEGGKTMMIESGDVRFVVEEVFKGDVKSETTIKIASMAGTSCGPYGLVRNVRYVVYAYGNERNGTILYSGVCTRTISVESSYAKEDLSFLRNLPPVGTGGKLEGQIWYDSRITSGGAAVPMPNLKVVVRGSDNKEIIVKTDKQGEFEIENLKTGTYLIKPLMPKNFFIEKESQTVEVADRGTATIGFEAYYTGKVSGRVADIKGGEYNSIFLHLLSTDEGRNQKNVYGHSTGENGAFEFEGVPPGNYVMFLELQNDDYKNNRKYYYPGTYDRAKAAVIRVGLGGKVEGIKFTLPREYEVRTIEGKVLLKDGNPAVDAEVVLRCPTGLASNKLAIEFGAKSTKTDQEGKFKLQVFAGETYWLSARFSKTIENDDIEYYSLTHKILVKENIKNQELVLSERTEGKSCP